MPILAILTTPLVTASGQGAINQTKKQMEMKKIFFVAIGIACLMASCTKDSTIEQPKVNPFAGREVIFSTNADDNSSRTIYGTEVKPTETDASWYYPVYWKKGDQILVYGKDSKTKATYDVNVEKDGTQNFATSLNKVEANGVQWGTNATSDFFAVYPAKDASFNEDGSINTKIAQTQYNVFAAAGVDTEGNAAGWVGQPFDTDATNPTMTNAIMYAYTKDASAYELNEEGTIKKDTNGNPIPNQKVELNFKPFSTVLKFRLAGFAANLETSAIVNVTKITITAPADYKISGDFTITPTVTDGTVSATAEASTSDSQNTIEIIPIISTGSYLPITVGQYVEFNVFAMPLANQQILTSGNWTVKVETALHGNYTCTLKPTANKELAPGKIHKIAVPAITSLNTVEWNYSKWMTQIPPKVYLSELSVPGTWYTNDSKYQATTDVATLYNAGIRAFNIDCRVTKNPGRLQISDGYITSKWADTDYPDDCYLACAGTERAWGVSSYQLTSLGAKVSDVVQQLCNLAAANPKEYIVIVFTFAEKPMTNSGDTTFGSIKPEYITAMLKNILQADNIAKYLHTGINKDTTIEDVLTPDANNVVRNVIVKINHSNVDFATSTSPSFDMPTGIMASFASMAKSGYTAIGVTDIITGITNSSSNYYGYYSKMQSYPIYNGKTASGLMYHYHQAQNTTNDTTQGVTTYTATPTLGNRMDAIDNIIAESTKVYNASAHDAWFQIGIGGSIDGDDPAGMAPLVTYLKTQIDEKAITDPSPVGIVLMNHATSTGAELVKSIIDMNAKFYLKREGGDITTGGDDDSGSGSGSGNTEGGSGTGGETLPDN